MMFTIYEDDNISVDLTNLNDKKAFNTILHIRPIMRLKIKGLYSKLYTLWIGAFSIRSIGEVVSDKDWA